METIGLLLLLNAVVVIAFLAACAIHARLLPAPLATVDGGSGARDPGGSIAPGPSVPTGRQLEEYVQAGLDDLRIMLVQAARHRRD